MGDDKKEKAGGLFGNPLPLVMVVLLAAGVVVKTVPLQSARPSDPERVKYVPTSQQNVEARLWQDPFAAVEKHEKQSDQSNRSSAHTPKALQERIRALRDANPNRLTVLAVSVFGGSYAEAAESRRRSRFAVVSALGFHRYYPENEDAIGYFHIDLPEPQSSTSTFDLVVPYEWYENRDNGNTSNVLVLWLNEDKLTTEPLRILQELFDRLSRNQSGKNGLNVKLIGPAGSAMLAELVPAISKALPKPSKEEEFAPKKPAPLKMSHGSTLEVFAPGATISDCDLLHPEDKDGKLQLQQWSCFKDFPDLLRGKSLPIIRTTGTDDVLTAALLWELWVRGVNREQAHKGQCEDGLVLIGERDTEYGRTLSRYLTDGFSGRCGATEPRPVRTFTYLRGLDGMLPDIDKSGSNAPPKDESSKSKDLRTQLEDAPPEHAEGRSQFDYLRRLGDEIERLDQKKQFAKNGVKAIGIVGSDVYDKLLILQALRGRFRDKIFFTTDLDARYLHADQKDWARNLVVASNFGLSLRPELQDSTLPFRDSYQTATYLATLIALTPPFDWTSTMKNWLRPKIFEIGRTEAVYLASPSVPDLTGWINGTNPEGITSPATDPKCGVDWKECNSIEPDWPSRGLSPEYLPQILIMLCLGTLLVVLANRRVNETVRAAFAAPSPERNTARAIIYLVIGAVVLMFTTLARIWSLMENSLAQGVGEPFLWLEGVSVWPSLVVRFVCLVTMLAGAGALSFWIRHRAKHISTTFEMALPQTRKLDPSETFAWLTWLKRPNLDRSKKHACLEGPHLTLASFDKEGKSETNSAGKEDSGGKKIIDVTTLWQNYIRATSWNEMAGWIVVSLIIGFIVLTLAFQVLGRPSFPHRGELIVILHHVLVGCNALVLWLVIFWVAYETRACAQFIETLSGVSNEWPTQLLAQKEKETGVSREHLDDYLDFQLIVHATQRIHWLIYLPFVSILFMVLARSNFFDAMDFPLALVFVIGLALGYSLHSARVLRKSAEAARVTALKNYDTQLLKQIRPKDSLTPAAAARAEAGPGSSSISVEQIRIMMERIRNTHDGAFAPFAQQPALQALLLPFGGYGSVQLIEYLFKL